MKSIKSAKIWKNKRRSKLEKIIFQIRNTCKYFIWQNARYNSFQDTCLEYYLAFFILPCWSVYSNLLTNDITKLVLKTLNPILLMHLIYLLILIKIRF